MDNSTVVTGASTEPLLTRAGVVTIATAVLAGLGAWGLPMSGDQKAATIGLVAALAPLVLGWWARRHVNSPATMSKVMGR